MIDDEGDEKSRREAIKAMKAMNAQIHPQMTQMNADWDPARIASVAIARSGRMEGGGGGMLCLHRGRRAQPFQGWGPEETSTQGRPAAGQPGALMRNPLGVRRGGGGSRTAGGSERAGEVSGALTNAATGDAWLPLLPSVHDSLHQGNKGNEGARISGITGIGLGAGFRELS